MKSKSLGTHDIARLCQVTPPTAIRWIEQKIIPSFRTAGGHRRVWDKDLVVFLKEHNLPVPPELEASAGGMRILIVDDEPSIRSLLLRLLGKAFPQAELHEAADGFDAGRKVARLSPSLIILDLQLPGVDGLNVCRAIRSDEKLRGLKILAITGRDVEQAQRDILEAGADDFLGKPFQSEEIVEKTKRLLEPPH